MYARVHAQQLNSHLCPVQLHLPIHLEGSEEDSLIYYTEKIANEMRQPN
jgi:hypothetical protein